MNKFKIIGFGIVCSFLIWGLLNWFENNKKTERIWNDSLKNQRTEKLTFESVDIRHSTHTGRYFITTSQTNIYLNVKDSQGEKVRLGINEDYSFLDKSQIILSYVQIFGKRCPLKLEAIFENKTYSLKDWGISPPLQNSIEDFVQNDCF